MGTVVYISSVSWECTQYVGAKPGSLVTVIQAPCHVYSVLGICWQYCHISQSQGNIHSLQNAQLCVEVNTFARVYLMPMNCYVASHVCIIYDTKKDEWVGENRVKTWKRDTGESTLIKNEESLLLQSSKSRQCTGTVLICCLLVQALGI